MSVNAATMAVAETTKLVSSPSTGTQSALGECVGRTVRRYLADIGDTPCAEGLHALVLREVELPLLREVLAFHNGNQSRAATALGINRATLRKKLALHGLL
jgi:Fis family transcriptional regulator, factor for inversion stimulation protein